MSEIIQIHLDLVEFYQFMSLYMTCTATHKAHPFNSHTGLTLATFQHAVNSAVVSDCL